jgi:hypothetical protein
VAQDYGNSSSVGSIHALCTTFPQDQACGEPTNTVEFKVTEASLWHDPIINGICDRRTRDNEVTQKIEYDKESLMTQTRPATL